MDNKKIEELRELILNNEDYNEIVEKYGMDNIIKSFTIFSEAIVMIAEDIAEAIKAVANALVEVVKSDEFKDAIRKSDLFQEALDMCDYDIRERFYYLDDLLCELDDEIMEVNTEIVHAEVDKEIADKLFKNIQSVDGGVLSKAFRAEKLKQQLEYLQGKYDIVEDMYEEMLFNIYANIGN